MMFSALIGNPVDHSVSNHLFHNLGALSGLEYAHLKIPVPTADNLPAFVGHLRALGFRGCNVTLPYKKIARNTLDWEDVSVTSTGAVNTIVFSERGIEGYNTDIVGARRSFSEHLCVPQEGEGVLVFGAGGAARAVLHAVKSYTSNVFIVNRTLTHAESLCAEFGLQEAVGVNSDRDVFELIKNRSPRFYINTTSLGMSPEPVANPMSAGVLERLDKHGWSFAGSFFLDAVFNPAETRFLAEARDRGAVCIGGLPWMIYQAAKAFELWTGRRISLSTQDVNTLVSSLASIMGEPYSLRRINDAKMRGKS